MNFLRRTGNWQLGLFVSGAMHATWLLWDPPASASHAAESVAQEVVLEAVQPDPAPKEPEPEPKPEAAPAPEQAPTPRTERAKAAAAPPPPAAQAGRTLTAAETPEDEPSVADFTMVQGLGDSYVGGITTSTGESKKPVEHAAAVASARVGGGSAPAVASATTEVDHSAPAKPTRLDWSCSHLFPEEAEGIDNATVLITVSINAGGNPVTVNILRDPGHGFGAAARACALAQSYTAALSKEGRAIAAATPPITVHFTR